MLSWSVKSWTYTPPAEAMFLACIGGSLLLSVRLRPMLLHCRLHPRTQVRYTRKWCHVCALCQRENETSKLLHFWPKRVEPRSYVDRFCIWVQDVARKVATVARFRCGRSISWVLAHSCPKNATVTRFRCGAEHIPLVSARRKLHPCDSCPPSHWVIRKLFQCEFCAGTTCASQLLPSTLIGSTMFKLRGW